jgi:hypothetical protein
MCFFIQLGQGYKTDFCQCELSGKERIWSTCVLVQRVTVQLNTTHALELLEISQMTITYAIRGLTHRRKGALQSLTR